MTTRGRSTIHRPGRVFSFFIVPLNDRSTRKRQTKAISVNAGGKGSGKGRYTVAKKTNKLLYVNYAATTIESAAEMRLLAAKLE